MIQIENLTKRFGDLVAVQDLTLNVQAGETIGLLGPNGAGKTTAISMMLGLLTPDSGTVQIGDAAKGGGNPMESTVRRLIGAAPQALAIYGELTARENLFFFGKIYGLKGSLLRQRVEWALEFAKLVDRQNDRVDEFSGGMKRRLNIAVGLIHEPQILLLDEPTVGVDPQSRNHIFDCIETLQAKGMTIIYTTHYMEEAQRLCDRVAIVDHGRLLALDSVGDLVNQLGGVSLVEAQLKSEQDAEQIPDSLGDIDGTSFRFESHQPFEEISRLTSLGIEFQSLKISQPDLESVFLSLTGRSLRD